MHRRTLLKVAAVSAGASLYTQVPGTQLFAKGVAQPPVKRVLLVAKCHFDAGFIATQRRIVRRYFDVFFPQAIKTAADLRQAGGDRYVWTTGSWLLYEYLEQAQPQQKDAMEQAIAAGDIAWHALPFTWQTEMLDRTMILGGLGFSTSLDARYGRKTIGAKMTDVPGHTRGIIEPLHRAGVRLLDVGVNAASTPPDVPELFLWKDSAGNSLAMMYHREDYGGIVQIPGSDTAVDIEVRADNSGPHTPEEIAAIYAKLRARFPGATIQAATMSDVAAAVDQVRDKLPVVTQEIGDTWIYGVASDPIKVARYRGIARLRRKYLDRSKFDAGDAKDRQILRHLLLGVEHTWGADTKSFLDYDHYRPQDLAQVVRQEPYQTMQVTWEEKRLDLADALVASPADLHYEFTVTSPELNAKAPSTNGMTKVEDVSKLVFAHYTIGIDPATGAIVRLTSKASGREWASPQNPLALFTYQTLSAEDYTRYRNHYIRIRADWALKDFGKPGIEKFDAVSQEWHPRLVQCWHAQEATEERLVMQLRIDDAAAVSTGNVAWPTDIWVELRMPDDLALLHISVNTLGKVANRLPEAMWLTFHPAATQQKGWTMDKSGETVDPLDVVRGGGRRMHALDSLRYTDSKKNKFEIATLDAPAVAFGDRSPLNFSFDPPDPSKGAHFSLHNNAWGTNYVQWTSGDWLYRFTLTA